MGGKEIRDHPPCVNTTKGTGRNCNSVIHLSPNELPWGQKDAEQSTQQMIDRWPYDATAERYIRGVRNLLFFVLRYSIVD